MPEAKKPENLFFSQTFLLIVLGSILYCRPIILSICEKGFSPDRLFDLVTGLAVGGIATRKKMEQENVYTPTGLPGRDKWEAVMAVTQAAQATETVVDKISEIVNGEVKK